MTESFHLVLRKGPGPGQVFSLEKDEIVIGRDILCDISIIETSLSRRHARLFKKEGAFFVEDLGSTNGTSLDGQPVTEPQELKPGALLTLGKNIEFSLETVAASSEATAVFSRDLVQAVVPKTRASRVFISYSRKNKPFVEKLYAGLTEMGLNTWVDWKGIPLTVDWWAEIQEAIEDADGFVFVISPDSLASEICAKELQTAIDLKKRLIPILYIDPPKDSVIPDAISSHNWVFMKDESGLQEMLPKLVDSINTNYEWVQAHTRLVTRAIEWARRDKNNSLLLQGDDLQNAEHWLESAGDSQPQPTPLQIEYIQASRRNANQRQRSVMIATLVALAVTFVLAIVSFSLYLDASVARKEAVTQAANAEIARSTAEAAEDKAVLQAEIARTAEANAVLQAAIARMAEDKAVLQAEIAVAAQEEAVRQAQKAYAGEIGANALTLVDIDPPLAALLALESLRISPGDTTAEEVLSLIPAFYPPLIDGIPDPNEDVSALDWSSDGRLAVATGGESYEIYVYDLLGDADPILLSGHGDRIETIAWSDDGRLASGDEYGAIYIWNLETGEPDRILPVYQDGVTDLAWNERGKLASVSEDSSLIIWDAQLQDYEVYETYESGLTSVDWNPQGGLVTGAEDGSLIVWNTAFWTPDVVYTDHQAGILSLDVNENGIVATGSKDGTVIVRSVYGARTQVLRGHTDWVNVVRWSDDGKLASGSWDDTIILWDLEKSEPEITLRGHRGAIYAMDWGPGGLLASGVRSIYIWDAGGAPAMKTYEGHLDWIYGLEWTPDGQLVSSSSDGKVFLWDAKTETPAQSESNWGTSLDVSTEGYIIAGGNFIDFSTGFVYGLLGYDMRFSPDGRYLAGRTDAASNEIGIWEIDPLVTAGEPVSYTLSVDEDLRVKSVTWSPDGSLIASGLDDGSILIWDFATGSVVETLNEHQEAVVSLDWNPDGRLASAAEDGRILIWDVPAASVTMELFGVHQSLVESLDWGPDGLLASSSDDGRIAIWDTATGEVRATVRAPYKRSINDVAWSPDGTQLAFGGNSYFVYIYNTDYAQDPCSWLVRNMTEDEWFTFLPDEEYRKTCPNLD